MIKFLISIFFTFSCTIWPSYSSCQISIHYEHQKSFYFNIYFWEFTAAINQPWKKVTSKTQTYLTGWNYNNNQHRKLHKEQVQSFCCFSRDFQYLIIGALYKRIPKILLTGIRILMAKIYLLLSVEYVWEAPCKSSLFFSGTQRRFFLRSFETLF